MDHMVQEKTSSVVSGGRQYLISTAIVEIIGVVKCDTVSDVSRNKADWVKEWGWGGERGRCRGREKEEGGGGERERAGDSGISAFPPGVFGLHDFICEAIINFLNEISN